jgi:DNA-directed RNA polymerase specialized sigma24 family protein
MITAKQLYGLRLTAARYEHDYERQQDLVQDACLKALEAQARGKVIKASFVSFAQGAIRNVHRNNMRVKLGATGVHVQAGRDELMRQYQASLRPAVRWTQAKRKS